MAVKYETAEKFNRDCPNGTQVRYRNQAPPPARPWHDRPEFIESTTASHAWYFKGHPVVCIEGHHGPAVPLLRFLTAKGKSCRRLKSRD